MVSMTWLWEKVKIRMGGIISSTAADREEPIAPKRIGDYLIFILYLDNFVFDYFSLLLRHSSRRQTGQSQ